VNDALPWFRKQGVRSALGILWIVALYLLCRPYRGVRHDAMLYFGQTLFHQSPSWLQHDLFFQSTSQDQYSLFSTLFAPVLQVLGLSSAEIVTLLALHALLLFAVWQLTVGLATPARWIALALVLVLPHFYAADNRFGYGEPFLTARTLAEPFAVLALALALRSRRALALLALVVATLAHPLMTLPAWLVVWRLLCEDDRRWNWAALLIAPMLALAAWNVGPFSALAQRYDWQWLDIVRQADQYVFTSLCCGCAHAIRRHRSGASPARRSASRSSACSCRCSVWTWDTTCCSPSCNCGVSPGSLTWSRWCRSDRC
jgi:hypothetical protein